MKYTLVVILSICASVVFCQKDVVDSSQIQIQSTSDSIIMTVDGKQVSYANKDIAQMYLDNGLQLAANEQYDSALAEFKMALLFDLTNPKILYNIGLAQYFLQSYEDAIKSFDDAAEFDPSNADIYDQRGLCKALLGQYDDAETDFTIMLKYKNDFPMGNYNYGILLLEMGDSEKACGYLNKADKLGYDKAKDVITQYCD